MKTLLKEENTPTTKFHYYKNQGLNFIYYNER